ncbi:MAG: His/Gly/Thr/Pro-type tRNA ligase C-terminal domain-containing protein [Thermoleophilia bacterium]|nr:His/Gly/Thr/Pro-type tRNA ligase C-terminal domain-containing protein [Thermoleophilia bacterium]
MAHELRRQGAAAELDLLGRSVKGQMKQAGRSGARYAVIVGDDELATGTLTLKELATGREKRLPRIDAMARIVEAEKDGG